MTKRNTAFFVAVITASTLQACGGTAGNEDLGAASLNNTAPLPTTVSLARGASVDVLSANLRITFDSVTAESRCPSDVRCVQAGSATVALTTSSLSGIRSVQFLSLSTISGKDSGTAYGQPVRLLSVQPVPVSTSQIPQSAYRIELKVGADK